MVKEGRRLMSGLNVGYGRKIAGEMINFPNSDLIKIKAFENHVKKYGLEFSLTNIFLNHSTK